MAATNSRPPIWMRLLRLYGEKFPIHRGKARLAKAAFRHMPLPAKPIVAPVVANIYVELWPWLWADFCTYSIGGPELFVLNYFESLIHERAVVFDIGAYIGVYALTAAHRARQGRVVAFEPDPRSAQRLAQALAANDLHHVALCQCAVGDRAGNMTLSMGAYPPQSSLQGAATPAVSDQLTVSQVTIDDYCSERKILGIDVMKIDTEGAELNVLRGAASVIAHARPVLIVELHEQQSRLFGYTVGDTLDFLRSHGYRLFSVNPGLRNPRLQPFSFVPGMGRVVIVAQPSSP